MNKDTFQAINPQTSEPIAEVFANSTPSEIEEAARKAEAVFGAYRKTSNSARSSFLEHIADEIMALGDDLIDRCHLETALPTPRLQGERGRTVNQLKLFASLVYEGSWVDARIDKALPDRTPIPRPDLRHMLVPLGPVAIFGASNFPFAFSTAGGDTASALAAGCPVVVKAHPAHPGTSALVASAIQKAIAKCKMPEGVFSLLQGNTITVGQTLVQHPSIKAVGFTGSFRGGKALFDVANSRPEPIPVFAEMGSTNPVFFLPEALKEWTESLAQGLAGSITLGVGQFCTNPGLNFFLKSQDSDSFLNSLTENIAKVEAGTMLTPNIRSAYEKGLDHIRQLNGVQSLSVGKTSIEANTATAEVFKTTAAIFAENKFLSEENFGPSSILIEVDTKEQLLNAAKNLEGHLTATVHGTPGDLEKNRDLLDILEGKVGRIIINGYPTGVEVCHSMVHGGPFPATTAPQSTSVGTNAIKRFVRPICYQDYPDSLLPEALKDSNPLNIWRLVNGDFSK